MSDLRMEEQEDKTQSTTTTTATTTATIATTLTTSTTTSTSSSSSSSSSIITPVIKDEPVDSISQEVQMPLTSVNEDDNDGRICTPESQANDAVRGFLSKCIFCSKIFNSDDEAKLLECLHAACSSCIQAKLKDHSLYVDSEVVVEGNIVICQECNVESQFDNLIDNKFNVKFIDDDLHTDDDSKESDDEKICTSCHDNATATSWCDNCEEFICQNCVMAHQRLKITKEHTIRPKNEITNSNDTPKKSKKSSLYLFCSVHRHEQLSLFCQTCDRLTCRDCQLTDHRDHKYKFTHEIATETRGSVAKLLKEVTYKRVLLKSAMKVIEDRQVLILEKKKTLVQDITQMVVQLTNAINTRGKQLVMRLNEVCDLKQNTLNEKKIALDQLSKLTDHCIQFVNYALDKGSDMELLYSKKSVTGHLQRIKNRRADIPNPEIPVRINLSLEKVQDLIKVVSSIGAIVVDGRVYPSVSPSSRTSTPTTPSIDIQDAIKLTSSIAGNTSNTSDCPILPIAPQQMTTIAHGNTYSGVQLTFTNPQLQQQQQQSQSLVNPMQQPSSPIQSQNYLSTHYTNHPMPPNRTSPQAPQQHQQPRIPYNINFNGNIRQQLLLPQQRPMGQQQVTSSTHPQQQQQQQAQQQQQQQMHIDHQNASLRGLLAPFQRSINPNHNMAYRLPPSYRYPAGNPQIRASISHTYQPTNPGLVSGGRVQQIPQGQLPSYPIQQSPVTAAVATVTATVTTASIAASASSAAARWHIPQGTNNTMQYYNQRQSHQQQQQQPQIQQQQSQQNQQLLQQQHQLQQLQQQQFQLQQLQQYQQQSSLQIPGAGTPNDTFKIILKSQQNNIMPKNMTGGGTVVTDASSLSIGLRLGQAVSSSVPKTPSPIPGKSDETEKRLDNFCQKSLNDLLQTIAKLDSNGIVIIPEEHKNQLDSSHVDSSTDEGINNISENTGDISKDEQMTMTKDDPNEDWCAVCMDGGDAVLCCDRCPKVFHLYCHIPSLNTFPDESETWQCMLCTNILDCTENSSRIDKRSHSMNPKDLRIAQRIVLELYCQHEQSLPFREVVSYDITEYHKLIKKPIALDVIKKKLRHDDSNSYTDLREVLADIRLMFKNAYIFNPVDSQVYKEARNLEEFFEKLLVKWAPDYAIEYPSLALDDDDEVFPPNRKYRRIIND